MTVSRSAVAFRCMITGTLSSSPGESLTNINTRVIPDGAQCFVLEDRSLWRLNKASTASASTVVIVPAAGPGRWLKEVPSASAGSLYVAGLDQNSILFPLTNWAQPGTSAFGFPLSNTSPFTLTASGCVLTYNGASPQRFLVTLAASLNLVSTGQIFAGISREDDLTTTADGFGEGTQLAATLEAGEGEGVEDVQITCQRMVILGTGNTLRPKFRAVLGTESDLLINRLTLTAIAL